MKFFIIKIIDDGRYYLERYRGSTHKRSEAHIYSLKEIQEDSHLCGLLAGYPGESRTILLIPVSPPKQQKEIHASWCDFERWDGLCNCGCTHFK